MNTTINQPAGRAAVSLHPLVIRFFRRLGYVPQERLGHASGALADINVIVTSCVGKNDPPRVHEIASAVLDRILSSADCVRTKPSWYHSDWEQREWERYLSGDKKACASPEEACIDQARRLSAHRKS